MEKKPVEVIAEGKHLRFLRRGAWEYIERTQARSAVVVVAVTPENRLIFVEQYRPPVANRCVELPAGLVGDVEGEGHDAYAEAARRELIEETGYDAEEFINVTEGYPSPGQSNEHVMIVLARGLRRVAEGGGVDEEDIIVHEIALDEAEKWLAERLKAGLAIDPKAYLGLYFGARIATKR